MFLAVLGGSTSELSKVWYVVKPSRLYALEILLKIVKKSRNKNIVNLRVAFVREITLPETPCSPPTDRGSGGALHGADNAVWH